MFSSGMRMSAMGLVRSELMEPIKKGRRGRCVAIAAGSQQALEIAPAPQIAYGQRDGQGAEHDKHEGAGKPRRVELFERSEGRSQKEKWIYVHREADAQRDLVPTTSRSSRLEAMCGFIDRKSYEEGDCRHHADRNHRGVADGGRVHAALEGRRTIETD